MENSAIKTATDAAVQLTHLTHEASKAKTLVNDAVENGKRKAKRMAKRGYVAAEDYLDDTTYYIKRHPWQSVGIALGLGAGAGIVTGWLFSRTCTRSCRS
jgi:ElaB/YqjD/DUF883 family membrane-anchored ribosome-binding protein